MGLGNLVSHNLRSGDTVEVIRGARTGQVGYVNGGRRVQADIEYRVYFDECCQPFLARGDLRLRQRDVGLWRRPWSKAGRITLS